MSLLTARARKRALVGSRDWELQEFGQGGGPGLMHRRTYRHLDGLQIQPPRLAATVEEDAQQLVYLARDFLADGFRRFFSWGERVSSSGRARQILSFTSSNS